MLKFLKNTFISICVALFLLSVAGLALSGIDRSKRTQTRKELELFTDALSFIQAQYVDETKLKDLVYGALSGMASSLDPYSQFLTPQEYEDIKVETEGRFSGIGVEITIKDGLVTVVTPIEGTPAWVAGIMTGDRIVKIDGVVMKNFTLSQAVNKLRGKPGTPIVVVVWREKDNKLYTYNLKRAVIHVQDVKEAKILEPGIAYIRLAEFRETTPAELDKVLKELKAKGMDSLIIDLRNNPGGLLDKSVEITERFLKKGSVVVSVKGRAKDEAEIFDAAHNSPDLDTSLVVLVNEGSASGSEIFAGALKDNKRAIVIGTKTFGKGSIQSVFPLRDGSAMKITTSRYFTPSGASIHEKGIEPDITVEQGAVAETPKAEYKTGAENLDEILQNASYDSGEVVAKPVERPTGEDKQLSRAIDLLKSIRVYKLIEKAK